MHWAIALPFMVCCASALGLVVIYNPSSARPYRQVFAWIHRISGLSLLLLPTLVFLGSPRAWSKHLRNVREAWVWTRRDLHWLLCMARSTVNRTVQLPEQGKFNAGEKLNFMMVTVACPLFILTGCIVWLPGIAFYAWIVHFSLAVLVTPLMLGHIFMATVNPDTRAGLQGMISGYVNGSWAKHHYRAWYRELFERDRGTKAGASRPAPPVSGVPRPPVTNEAEPMRGERKRGPAPPIRAAPVPRTPGAHLREPRRDSAGARAGRTVDRALEARARVERRTLGTLP